MTGRPPGEAGAAEAADGADHAVAVVSVPAGGPSGFASRAAALALIAAATAAAFWLLPALAAALAAAFTAAALWAALTDLERYEIPDGASLAILAAGLAFAVAGGAFAAEPIAVELALLVAGVVPPGWNAAPGSASAAGLVTIADAVARAIVALAILRGVQVLYRRLRGVEGLGSGDVKLGAALAVWLAWGEMQLALTLAVAAALLAVGVAAIRRGRAAATAPIPFGAFLALAAVAVVFGRFVGLTG